jgi:hypothetical protein
MAIYRYGTFNVPTAKAALKLNLGFVPSEFRMWNQTVFNTGTLTGTISGWWNSTMGVQTTPMSMLGTWTTGDEVWSRLTTTGILPFQTPDSLLYVPNQVPYTTNLSTNLVITGISKAANASITATHSFTSADIGVTVVTFHSVVGMIQINTLSGIVQSVTSTTSFTVNIDSTNFTTYGSGGIANVITGAPANTLYGNVSLPTAEANLGAIGLTIGTGMFSDASVTAGDLYSYSAILQSPVTGP